MAGQSPSPRAEAREEPAPEVSVITVTYDSGPYVCGALESAQHAAALAQLSVELIAVDNASTDESVALVRTSFPAATVICNAENVGFGVANNQGLHLARGEYVLLINPDARLDASALGSLYRFLVENPLAGAASPAVRGPRARAAESAGMLPELRAAIGHFLFVNRLISRNGHSPWQGLMIRGVYGTAPRRVGWAGGAVLLLRTAAFRQVGGFDPRIFLYGEDIDLCARLGRAGWHVWLVPVATARHDVAGSQGGVSARWIDGLHDFYAGRTKRPNLVLFDLIMALGLGIRGVAAAVAREERQRRRMFAASRRAVRLAGRTLRGG
ncbi:MAG: glycosyltransferase family 2 protein [Dehalococcoidia bacterium]